MAKFQKTKCSSHGFKPIEKSTDFIKTFSLDFSNYFTEAVIMILQYFS